MSGGAKVDEWVEMHYLNEGVLAHPMHLHGLVQSVTAKAGFPLPQPYQADNVMVSQGERITVVIHVNKPGIWAWHRHILEHAERDDGMFGMVTAFIATSVGRSRRASNARAMSGGGGQRWSAAKPDQIVTHCFQTARG